MIDQTRMPQYQIYHLLFIVFLSVCAFCNYFYTNSALDYPTFLANTIFVEVLSISYLFVMSSFLTNAYHKKQKVNIKKYKGLIKYGMMIFIFLSVINYNFYLKISDYFSYPLYIKPYILVLLLFSSSASLFTMLFCLTYKKNTNRLSFISFIPIIILYAITIIYFSFP